MSKPYVSYLESPTPYDLVEVYGYDWQEELGESAYPVWDETMREWLNGQIYSNFKYREIGQETGEEFFRWLRIRLNQIMPVVNPVAAFSLGRDATEYDWRLTSEVIGKYAQANSGSNTSEYTQSSTSEVGTQESGQNVTSTTANTSSKNSNLTSTTPQVQLSGNKNYMTGLVENGAEGQSSGTETATLGSREDTDAKSDATGKQVDTLGVKVDSDSDVKTYEGLSAELAQRWLDAAPDILGNIFAGLESLFVQVW